jgi:hypothetical protein
VQWFERSQEWIEKLNALQARLNGFHERLLQELKAADAEWPKPEGIDLVNSTAEDAQPQEPESAATLRHELPAKARREALLPKLEELYRLFGYFNRWNRQIQERVVQLMI